MLAGGCTIGDVDSHSTGHSTGRPIDRRGAQNRGNSGRPALAEEGTDPQMLTRCIRRIPAIVTMLSAALLLVTFQGAAAAAAPGSDDEGAPPSVREALDIALRDLNDAKGRLDASRQRQATLTEQVRTSELRVNLLTAEAGAVAAAAYRGTRMNVAVALLGSGSPDGLLHAATTVQYMAIRDDRQLRDLAEARRTYAEQQSALEAEIKLQEEQVGLMEQKKREAEDALKRVGGGQLSPGVVPAKATAKPAPRNADGSWPAEGCSVDDPTTSGCLTPRTLHALEEARLAGYTRYTACYRSSGSGEHPKGRACDFSPTAGGFVDARASGADKTYGDKLAGWLIGNADVLGVMYVIWYKQIWFPSGGWR